MKQSIKKKDGAMQDLKHSPDDSVVKEKNIEEQKPKQSSDTWIAVVSVVIVLMLVAFVVFVHEKRTQQYESEIKVYNNFEFKRVQTLWQTEVQIGNSLIVIPMHYGPWETEHIGIQGKLNESFNYGKLYITFNPEQGNVSIVALATAELSLNLAQGLSRQLVAACATNISEPCHTRPIVDCDSEDKAVIYLQEGGDSKVIFDENCMVISGTGQELLKAVDRLLVFWYGILPAE